MENRLIKVAKRLASLWKASRQLRVGLLLFLGVLLVAILAGVLSPYDPYYLSDDLLMPPGSENHPLGTDHMGHDVLSMILHGSRTSLTIGIVSALISGLIGTMLGAFAGYFGGALDKITSEVINIFLMIPTFFLVLIIVSIFGSNMFNVMLVIGLTAQIGWQALLNIAVVTNSIPNTGISLPFFSAGGTALTMQLAQMGVILNVSRYCRRG